MGERLLSELAESTGLPADLVAAELQRLLSTAGFDPENVTLDDVRKVLADYMQDILLNAKNEIR